MVTHNPIRFFRVRDPVTKEIRLAPGMQYHQNEVVHDNVFEWKGVDVLADISDGDWLLCINDHLKIIPHSVIEKVERF